MTIAGFVTYLILLLWGPIGVALLIGIGFALFLYWAKRGLS